MKNQKITFEDSSDDGMAECITVTWSLLTFQYASLPNVTSTVASEAEKDSSDSKVRLLVSIAIGSWIFVYTKHFDSFTQDILTIARLSVSRNIPMIHLS